MQSFKQYLLNEEELEIIDGDVNIIRGHITNGILNGFDYSKCFVTGNFNCSELKLSSLQKTPAEIRKNFQAWDNSLSSLEFGPTDVGGTYNVNQNWLTSLEGAPDYANLFTFCDNKITSLAGMGKKFLKKCSVIKFRDNPIKSNILGLLIVKDLQSIFWSFSGPKGKQSPFALLENHLVRDKDIMDCQEELIQAGYKDFAKL